LLGHSPPTGGWVIGVASQDDDCNTVANNVQAFSVNAHATDEQDVPPGDIMGKSAFWLDQLCTYSNRVDFTKIGDNSWSELSRLRLSKDQSLILKQLSLLRSTAGLAIQTLVQHQ
jgi:hypothetical protein